MRHHDDMVVTWGKAGTTYVLIGVEFSKSNPNKHYKVVRAMTAEHEWVSCNCPAFTISKKNRGKKQWERTCRHTKKYTLNSPPLSPQEYSELAGIPLHQIEAGSTPTGCPPPQKQARPSKSKKRTSRFSYLEL